MSEDIRGASLLAQLDAIDVRELQERGARPTRRKRALQYGLQVTTLILMARAGVNIALFAVLPLLLPFGVERLVRHFVIRRLGKERERLLALYEKIDRTPQLHNAESESVTP